MTRRQIHGFLLGVGGFMVVTATVNGTAEWINRSDTFFAGFLVMALGLHGLWKTDPR